MSAQRGCRFDSVPDNFQHFLLELNSLSCLVFARVLRELADALVSQCAAGTKSIGSTEVMNRHYSVIGMPMNSFRSQSMNTQAGNMTSKKPDCLLVAFTSGDAV